MKSELQAFLDYQDYLARKAEERLVQSLLADEHMDDANELFAEAAESNGPDSYDDGDY